MEKISKLGKKNLLNIAAIILLVILGVIIVIKGVNDNNQKTSETNHLGYVEGQDYSDSTILTYAYEHEVLHGDAITDATSDIKLVLNELTSQNAYIRVQVGESEFDYYVYNKDGECLAQSSDGATCVVFRKDTNSVAFSGTTGDIYVGNDADIISIINNVIAIAESDVEDKDGITVFHMLKADESETPDTVQEYRVEIVGEENFKQIYNSIDEQLGTDILETLAEQVSQVSENEFVPHVIYTFLIDTDTKAVTIVCELVVDNLEHSNWILDGYYTLDDWSLDEAWYTSDFEQLTADESFEILDTLLTDIQSLIDKFAEENGLTDSEESSEEIDTNVENNESSDENEVESEEDINSDTNNESEDTSPQNSLDLEENTAATEE